MYVAQIPPPVCPKCGSHRTAIVGRSDDGRTIVLRCNACGARSELLVDDQSTAALTAEPSLSLEVEPLGREDDNHAA